MLYDALCDCRACQSQKKWRNTRRTRQPRDGGTYHLFWVTDGEVKLAFSVLRFTKKQLNTSCFGEEITLQNTNMSMDYLHFLIGYTSSTDCFSIIMLVFGGVYSLNIGRIRLYHKSQTPAILQRKKPPERNDGRGLLLYYLAKFLLDFRVGQHGNQGNVKVQRCVKLWKVSKDDDDSSCRRTRVVECPSGIDVSGVNALSVAEFLSTGTQQQAEVRDLKVSWSSHHYRFNCKGYTEM